MSIQHNTFCWHGIATPVDAGKGFYTRVLDWTIADEGPGSPVFAGPGGQVAHIQAPEGGPAAWSSFLSVDDVDASTARVVETGGTLLVPPTDLPAGRFSIVTTPSGAAFGLYQAVEQDELAKPVPGSITWVDLHSPTPDDDVAWLAQTFGFAHHVEQMPSGPYHILEVDGEARGGVTASKDGTSTFVAWVLVEDLDDTLGRVEANAGRRLSPVMQDGGMRRMALVADPGGASFGLVQRT